MPFKLHPSTFILCFYLLGSTQQIKAQALPGLPKIRDIAGPLPVTPLPPEGINTSTWILIAVLSLTLAALLFWFFSRDKTKNTPPASLMAARARLREAAACVPDDPHNELPTRLTSLLRLYLGETFQQSIISATTEQIAPALASVRGVPLPLVAKIVAFVENCDRSKFVPDAHRPDAAERSHLHNQSRELLEELALAETGALPHLVPESPPPLPPPLPPALPPVNSLHSTT